MLSPYLFFDGCCEEAIDFYTSALGAKVVMLMRFSDRPPETRPPWLPPGAEAKIMHATLEIGPAQLMMSDGMCSGRAPKFEGVTLSLTVPDVTTADRLFAALAAGGEIRQPLTETFFAPRFGMVADKFGVGWMIVVQQLA